MEPTERKRIEAEVRQQVRSKVRRRIAFNYHLALFVLVNAGLAAINLTTSPGYLWFLWPLAAWSIALFMHGFSAVSGGMRRDMIEGEVQRELARRGIGA